MPAGDGDARRVGSRESGGEVRRAGVRGGGDVVRRAGAREPGGGELIGERYELRTRLGRGGMGEVWSARDVRLHRDVAVKLFHGGDGMSAKDLPDWLRREGIAAAQIVHPNVAVLYDQGAHGDRIYLVLELVTGATLSEVMRGGRLPLRDALSFAAQVAEALAAAHAARVVHRDIKPQNILITPAGTAKVVDFGIAGFLADTRSWSIARTDDPVKGSGTPEYAAPEQVTGHNADARSDLYSLGTLLYAMLAGQPPFRADNFLTVMHRKATEDAPRLPAGAGAPREVADLIAELLQREPERRPASARQVAARLRALLAGSGRSERSGRGEAEVEVEGSESLDQRSRVGGSDDDRVGGGVGEKVVTVETGPWTAEVGPVQDEAAEKRPAWGPDAVRVVAKKQPDKQADKQKLPEAAPEQAAKPPAWGPDAVAKDRPGKPKLPVEPEKPAVAAPSAAPVSHVGADTAQPPAGQPSAAKSAPPSGPAESKPAATPPVRGSGGSAALLSDPAASKPAATPPVRGSGGSAAPPSQPAAKPPVWGAEASEMRVASPESSAWEPLAATGATVLSAVAEVEVRGRSLLPPRARSLLAGPVGERYVPVAEPVQPEPVRRTIVPVVLIVLVVAVVAVGAIMLTSR